jgi:hypothetical protein
MSKLVWYDYNPAAGILQARYTPPAPPRTPTLHTFTWHTNTGKEPKGYIEVRQRRPKRPRQLEGSGALIVCNDECGEVSAVPLSAHAVDLLDVNEYLYGRWSKVQRRKGGRALSAYTFRSSAEPARILVSARDMLSTQVKVWVGPDACLCTVVSVELDNEQRIVFGLYYRKSELLFSELLAADGAITFGINSIK